MAHRTLAGANEVLKPRAAGFTAVELLVIIAVLGVLASLAFPSMRDYLDKQRLIGQARAVSNLAQLARSEAIKRSAASGGTGLSTIAMTVNPGSPWSVGLATGNAACTPSGPTYCVIQGSTDTQLVTANECPTCTMTSPTTQQVIVFDLRGLVTGGTDQAIVLQSPLGKQIRLSVSRLGRISLCSPAAAAVVGVTPC